MSRNVTLRLDDEAYQMFAEAAKADNRSIANFIFTAAVNQVREQQFVEDDERATIRQPTS